MRLDNEHDHGSNVSGATYERNKGNFFTLQGFSSTVRNQQSKTKLNEQRKAPRPLEYVNSPRVGEVWSLQEVGCKNLCKVKWSVTNVPTFRQILDSRMHQATAAQWIPAAKKQNIRHRWSNQTVNLHRTCYFKGWRDITQNRYQTQKQNLFLFHLMSENNTSV